jgi:uncharacterized protein YkwD
MRRLLPLPLLLALLALVPAPAGAAKCSRADILPTAKTVAAAARSALCLVNAERRKRDVPALRTDDRLTSAAGKHSRDMVKRGYFDHVTPSGTDPGDRIAAAGYKAITWGENIAWGSGGYASPRQIVRGWMNSPGHRANILRKSFEETGMGVAFGAPERGVGSVAATYSQVFATAR